MPVARRKLKLSYPEIGESILVELLDDEAPRTSALVWDLLPLEHDAVHGQFSGAEVFVKLATKDPAPAENLTWLPLPGELFYFFDPGDNVTSGGVALAEICFVYGRGVVLRGPEGVPSPASLFARVPGDWKYDWVAFSRACRRVRFASPQRLRIERA